MILADDVSVAVFPATLVNGAGDGGNGELLPVMMVRSAPRQMGF